jgi:hypothetical protein
MLAADHFSILADRLPHNGQKMPICDIREAIRLLAGGNM